MTLWEFAIARHFGQLLAESEARELTEKESERLEVLGRRVEVYEAREMHEKAHRRQTAKGAGAAGEAQAHGQAVGGRLGS
jgi:hypothetical protein